MNCAQIGKPGTGKTYNLLTILPFAKAVNKPLAIIDSDDKLAGDPFFAPHIHSGLIDLFSIPKQHEDGLVHFLKNMKNPPSKEPKGYLLLAEAIDKVKANESQYSAVAMDTLTSTQEHLRELIKFTNRRAHFEFADWGLLLINFETLFADFFNINVPLKIINMHSKMEKDEHTGEIEILPMIDGGFVGKAGAYVSEFYLCTAREVTKGTTKEVEYRWRTRPNAKFNARSNIFKEIDVLQTWEPVWKAIQANP